MTREKTKNQAYIITGLALIAFFGWLSVLELRAEEPRRAVVAMEMVLSGDWSTPTLNGWPYFNKPPVFNWIMAILMRLTGSFSEVIVRIPSLLAFLGIVWTVHHMAKVYLSEWKNAALIIPLAVVATAEFVFLGTVNSGEIDLFYSLVVFLQVYAIFHYSQKANWLKMFVISYGLAATGLMIKGLPSILFQGLTLFPWLIYTSNARKLLSIKHLLGILVFFMVSGSVLMVYQLNGVLDDFISRQIHESTTRYTEVRSTLSIIKRIAFYPLNIIVWTLPWGILAPFWLTKTVRKTLVRKPLVRFILLYIGYNIPVYWFSAVPKSRYIFMILPWIVILLVLGAMEAYRQGNISLPIRKLRPATRYLWLAGVALAIGLFILPPFNTMEGIYGRISAILMMMFGIYLLQRRWITDPWYHVILFVFSIRIAFNLIYLPYLEHHNPSNQYRQNVGKILATNNNKPVHYLANADYFEEIVDIFDHTVISGEYYTAPLIPYQIPYYISLSTNQIMQLDTLPSHEQWYLAELRHIPEGQDLKDSIYDYWLHRTFYLFQYTQPGNSLTSQN